MKIGILCTGRCGSTSLFEGIRNSIFNKKKYEYYFEPNRGIPRTEEEEKLDLPLYNITIDFSNNFILSKDLVNTIPGTIPYNYSLSTKDIIYTLSNYYINYSKNFDIILLLMRQNELSAVQSWDAVHRNNTFFEPWKFNSQDMEIVYPIKKLDHIRNINDVMYNIAKQLKKPIIYYEDLFSGSKEFILNFIKEYNLPIENFDILYSYLDPKSKYNLRKNE